MKKLHLCFLFLSLSTFLFSQDNAAKALELGQKAIQLIDAGQLDESIGLLLEAQKLDPKRIDYPYEIALANYLKEDYQKAIDILTKLLDHKDVSDNIYQLLGNSYDLLEAPNKALETYEKGMKKFPNSGKFHLESGQIKFTQEAYNEAIAFWEAGIKIAPEYPSNYYRLAKIFAQTEEKIWALIYGEYFILLEPNTPRTEEISKLLFAVYQDSYTSESDSTGSFHLTKRGFEINILNKKDLKKIKNSPLPFEGTFATTFSIAAIGFSKGVNLASIYNARRNFLDIWFKQKKFNLQYPNKLLDYQQKIEQNDLFQTYSYWILSQGQPELFEAWFNENPGTMDTFAEWFFANRISIKKKDFISRRDYD